jgi:O-antigen/teichoic acid export membrane protein
VFTPLLVFRTLSEARQRAYRNWLLLTMQVLTSTSLCLFAAYMGWGLLGQSVALTVAQLPTLFILAWDGHRAFGGVWAARSDRADRDEVRSLSWPTLIHGLTDRVGLLSDNILIAWVMGPRAIASLVLTQQLASVAQSQLKGFGAATWAGLTELHVRGDHARFQKRLLELTGVVSGLSVVMLTPIAAFNRSFVRVWVGEDAFAGELVTVLACFTTLMWAVHALWGWALLGTGQIRRWVPFGVFATLVNVVASVIGTVRLGVAGPLLGTTTGMLLVTSWALPGTLHRTFGIPPRTLWRTALAPYRWGVPYAATLWTLSRYWQPAEWLGLIAALGLGTAAGLSLWWSFSFGSEERREWKARLGHAVRRS